MKLMPLAHRLTLARAAVGVALGLTACAGETPSARTATPKASTPTMTSGIQTPVATCPPVTEKRLPQRDESEALTPPQLVALAIAVNDTEIEQARYASSHTSSPRLKRYASDVVSGRTVIGRELAAAVTAAHLIPMDPTQSYSFKSDARATLSTLEAESGSSFDRMFMESQVLELELTRALLDPNVANADVRDAVENERSMISHNLESARDVLRALLDSNP